MKTMKKVLTLLLGVAMILSFAGAGAGAELLPTTNDKSEVTVTYSNAGSYEISLPESITLKDGEGVNAEVTVTSLELPTDWKLLVSVASNNGWKISDGTTDIEYKMSYYSGSYNSNENYGGDSSNVAAGSDILLIRTDSNYYNSYGTADAGGNTGGKSYLYFELIGESSFGQYTDTLTFTISPSTTEPYVNVLTQMPSWYSQN